MPLLGPAGARSFGYWVQRMNRIARSLTAAPVCVAVLTRADARSPTERYTCVPAGAGDLGKCYMGRDLAGVMGRQGAAWLEREERTDLLVTTLWTKPGMAVANIGAGTGHLARSIASANRRPNAHGVSATRLNRRY